MTRRKYFLQIGSYLTVLTLGWVFILIGQMQTWVSQISILAVAGAFLFGIFGLPSAGLDRRRAANRTSSLFDAEIRSNWLPPTSISGMAAMAVTIILIPLFIASFLFHRDPWALIPAIFLSFAYAPMLAPDAPDLKTE